MGMEEALAQGTRVRFGPGTLPTVWPAEPPALPQFPGGVFPEVVAGWNKQIQGVDPQKEFRALDVVVGDRIRMISVVVTKRSEGPAGEELIKTRVDRDASVLEGKVIGLKVRHGRSQVRIDGFGHTGPSSAGGQHVWFPVEDYKIEVLHRVYRFTDEDRLVVAVGGFTDRAWERMSEQQRETNRASYKARVEKIRTILTPSA